MTNPPSTPAKRRYVHIVYCLQTQGGGLHGLIVVAGCLYAKCVCVCVCVAGDSFPEISPAPRFFALTRSLRFPRLGSVVVPFSGWCSGDAKFLPIPPNHIYHVHLPTHPCQVYARLAPYCPNLFYVTKATKEEGSREFFRILSYYLVPILSQSLLGGSWQHSPGIIRFPCDAWQQAQLAAFNHSEPIGFPKGENALKLLANIYLMARPSPTFSLGEAGIA